MWKVKDYPVLYMVLPFVTDFIDRAAVRVEQAQLMGCDTM